MKCSKILALFLCACLLLITLVSCADNTYNNRENSYDDSTVSELSIEEVSQPVSIDEVIGEMSFDFPPKQENVISSIQTMMQDYYGFNFARWATSGNTIYCGDYGNQGSILSKDNGGYVIQFHSDSCGEPSFLSDTDINGNKYWSITCLESKASFMASTYLNILFGNCIDLAYSYSKMDSEFNYSSNKNRRVTSTGNCIEGVTYEKSGIEFQLTKYSQGQYVGKEVIHLTIRLKDEEKFERIKREYAETVLKEYNAVKELYESGDIQNAVERLDKILIYNKAKEYKSEIQNNVYEKAVALYFDGNYEDAANLFEKIKDFKDSITLLSRCKNNINLSDNDNSQDETNDSSFMPDISNSDDKPQDESSKAPVEELRPAHTHTFVLHAGKSPTCTEPGYSEYKTCAECGYSDYKEIPALGHQYVLTEKVDATCDKDGYRKYQCANCGDSYQEVIYATGHDLAPATCLAPSTCKKCGKTFGSVGKHEYRSSNDYYADADGIQCVNCGKFNNSWTKMERKINYAAYTYSPGHNNNANSIYFDMDEYGRCKLKIYYNKMIQTGYNSYTREDKESIADYEFQLRNETYSSYFRGYIYDCYNKNGVEIDDMKFEYYDRRDYGRYCDIVVELEDGWNISIEYGV